MIITKTTHGYVEQFYDTDAQAWLKQEFKSGGIVEYSVDGDDINQVDFEDRVCGLVPYLAFDMVQPKTEALT